MSIAEDSSRSTAFFDKTGWVAQTQIDFAPAALSASAAVMRVPPVSIISSAMRQSRPLTSPIILSASAFPGAVRRLSIIARGAAPSSSANTRERLLHPHRRSRQ